MLRSTVSRPVCLGVKPHLGSNPDFYYCQTVAVFLMLGVLSDERTGLSFTIAAGSRQRSHFCDLVPRDSVLYFIVSDSRFPQPGGPVPRIHRPGTWWHWVPFSSPPTTRMATMQVYEAASARAGSTRKHRHSFDKARTAKKITRATILPL
jgi:hypothetical protein